MKITVCIIRINYDITTCIGNNILSNSFGNPLLQHWTSDAILTTGKVSIQLPVVHHHHHTDSTWPSACVCVCVCVCVCSCVWQILSFVAEESASSSDVLPYLARHSTLEGPSPFLSEYCSGPSAHSSCSLTY